MSEPVDFTEDYCIGCGGPLPEKRTIAREWCGAECYSRHYYAMEREARREARQGRPCAVCAGPIDDHRPMGTKFCSYRCQQRAKVVRRHETTLAPRPCITCGLIFKPGRKDKVACSNRCQKLHWLAQQGPDYDEKELEAKRASVAAKRAAHPPKPCAWCGAEFKPEGRKGRKELWCSNSCRAKAWRASTKVPPETRTCAHCGAGFEVKPSSKRRFCSQACGRQANRLPRTPSRCEHCGWTFTPRRLRRERTLRFCSRECAWRGLRGTFRAS